MWIIPKTSRFCHFAPGMAASNLEWPAHWRILLESLQWRSKPTPWRTWLLRLKRVSWLSRLCGRICEPSRRSDFEDALISSLRVTRANHTAAREREAAQKTPATFGPILLESSRQSDLFGVSSRTSADTLASDSPMFIATYEIWVTRLRLDYLARQSAVRPTGGSDSLSWPTIQTADANQAKCNKGGNAHLNLAAQWMTPEAQNQEGYQIVNGKKIPRPGEQVKQWPTPNVPNRGKELSKKHRPKAGGIDLQSTVGLLDRDNLNTNGKNRELWATPNIPDRGGPCGQHSDLRIDLKCSPRRLNPDWVEQLQGLPVGWTDLDSSEMESSPSRRKRRSDV